MWRWIVVAVLTCGACGAPARPPEHLRLEPVTDSPPQRSCEPQLPIGAPSQFSLRTVAGFEIAAPQTCHGASYIRIERTSGARKLGIARLQGGGFSEGCTDLAHVAGCDKINVGALLAQVTVELHREGLEAAGNGAGPCAPNLNGDYSGWNFAVGVHDWKDSDRLVRKITELMDRYDLAGYVGASIYTIPCAFAD